MIEKIILKRNWEDVKAGCSNSLNFMTEEQVRHLFGDSPHEHITRIRIIENVEGCDKKKLKKDLRKAEKERDAQKAALIIKKLVECEEDKNE